MPLPPAWQRFVARTRIDPGTTSPGTHLAQRGEIALAPGRFAPFTAEQTFDAARCGFVWHARVRMAPMVTAVVEDAFEDGHGRLEAKVFGFLRVAHGTPGVALDRGELLRYLAELAWNPLAILRNPELVFEELPGDRHRVGTEDPETQLECTFDADGDLAAIATERRHREGYGPCAWSGRFGRYEVHDGVRIPTEAEVSWDPPTGREVYFRCRVEEFGLRADTQSVR